MSRRAKLEQMLEKSPDDGFLNFGLAMELAKEGLTEEALARFDRVLQLDPAYIAAHLHKSRTLIRLGRTDEARAALTTGIEASKAAGDTHAADELQRLLDGIP
jgi:Flp pilus assembly protein TadD